METYRFRGIVTAISSITHNGGQSFGTESKLRREKLVQPDGTVEEVPVLSGNGIRGKLRDVGMIHMLRALGYGENGKGATLPAFHFLLSGGSLTSNGGKAVSIREARRLRELIPLVGIFGGGVGNALLPGVLKCGKMIPICTETLHLLPKAVLPAELAETRQSCWDFTQTEMYTRRDDSKDERRRELLSGEARKLLEAADDAKQSKSAKEPVERNDGSTTQMQYFVETLAAGTRFYWEVVLDDPTPLEMEAFMTCLVQFSQMPYVGGKSSVGLGEVSVDFRNWIKIDSRNVAGTEVAMPAGTLYAKHLKDRAQDIRATLESFA